MELPREAMLLRIFLGESDEMEGEPVFRKIVLKAREMNLAGATVLRGPLGFGRSTDLHTRATFRFCLAGPYKDGRTVRTVSLISEQEKPILYGLASLLRAPIIDCPGKHRSTVRREHRLEAYATLRRCVITAGSQR
jgi:hypothetical protein